MPRWLFPLLALCLLSAHLGAAPRTKADLTKAHELRQQRKYEDARSRFALIAKSPETPLPLRQEAGYWMGYCSVMEQAFLKAIQDFRWYLDSSKVNHAANPFLPDALYVLGRTYEAYGQPAAASYYYQQCLRTKSAKGTPFPAKAKAGLIRIKEMLQDEYRRGGPQPAGTANATGTAPLIDPFSQQPIPQEQYERLKKFMALVAKKTPLPKALESLTPADRKLELVTRLVVMYEEAAKKSRVSAPGKKKNPPSGKPKPK